MDLRVVKPTCLFHWGIAAIPGLDLRGRIDPKWVEFILSLFLFLGIKLTCTMKVSSHAPTSSLLALHTRTTQAAVIYPSGRHRPPVVIISICGDDKVTPGFVSTERPRGGLPSQIKESLHFRRDNGKELPYEYDHGTPGLLRPSISPRRAPRRQITPWISPLNLNFSGCIKRWSQ